MSKPFFKVDDLRKSYGGIHAVDRVSFEVHKGQSFAIIGANGAGKTTCFNLMTGAIKPDQGSVLFRGHELIGLSPRRIWRLGIGRTFQITKTFHSFSALENVQMALISHHKKLFNIMKFATNLYRAEAMALLTSVGINDLCHTQASILAYGDLKRLELAVALAHDPQLLLMDEPTAGMAKEERIQLMSLLNQIIQDKDMSIIFTEHDMDIVFNYSTQILVLDRGQVIAMGSPNEVQQDDHVKKSYLGADFSFTPKSRF